MAKPHLKLVTPATVNRTVTPSGVPMRDLRTREYLTEAEVERLMKAAKGNRWGHRDATMILVAYRHGLRASELVDLRWDQVDFSNGHPARPQGQAGHARAPIRSSGTNCGRCGGFSASRSPSRPSCSRRSAGAPFTTAGFARMVERAGDRGQAWLQGASAHAAARLRLRAGQQGPRHPRAAGLPRAQEHSAHGALHRAVADAVQGFLARLNGSFVRLLRKPIVQINLDAQFLRLIG